MPAHVVTFGDEHVPGAARLLAQRHAAHRQADPLLPVAVDFEEAVGEELSSGSGVVALDGAEIVGYLIGRQTEDAVGGLIRVGISGWATHEHSLTADLYAAAAAEWVDAGCRRHFVFVPNVPVLVEPWFRLSFGASAALALRDVADDTGLHWSRGGIDVRSSSPDDLDAVAELATAFNQDLNSSPSFGAVHEMTPDEQRAEWSDTWTDDRMELFVAEVAGEIVGELLLYRRPQDLRVPPSSIDLANCVVSPAHRGKGIGVSLTRHAVHWARTQGLRVMTADWRWTNLPAAHFWPRRGFREVFVRLYRSIP